MDLGGMFSGRRIAPFVGGGPARRGDGGLSFMLRFSCVGSVSMIKRVVGSPGGRAGQ